MNICLIGGIYGQRGTASGYLKITPETTLECGLRRAGHQVTTLSHYAATDFGRFDVVHVHHLSYGATRLASDPSRAPFVFTVHDASPMSGARLPVSRALALRYVLSRADRIVSLSRAEQEFQKAAYRIAPGRLATIPNGIDADLFPLRRSNDEGRGGAPWRLLFVGQLIPLKGCDLIIRAIARLLPKNVELTLAYQTADLESELKALASENGLAGRVHFAGRQDPAALAKLYQQSDLLVLASETEALPSVITEAMLSGLPFVSTNVGGIAEQSAGFGHLLAERTCEALSTGIGYVLDHYGEFSQTAAAMSSHARRSYSIDSMVSLHEELYRSVLGERPRRLRWSYAAANQLVRAAVARSGNRPPHLPNQSSAAAAERSS